MKTLIVSAIFSSLFLLSACADNNETTAKNAAEEQAIPETRTIENSKEKANFVVESAKDKTQEVVAATKEKSAALVSATKEKAEQGIEKAKENIGDGSAAKEMLEKNKDKLKDKLGL